MFSRMKQLTAILLFFIVLAQSINSQNTVQFQQFISPKNGLTGNYFFSVVEDSYGYIWLGGRNGLQRYGMNTFTNFNQLLNHTHVLSLYEDRQGFIWICTGNGLLKLDPFTQSTKEYFPTESLNKSILSNKIETVFEDDSGIIWVGTENGLFAFYAEEELFIPHFFDSMGIDPPTNRYYAIQQDRYNKNLLWLATQSGLQQFDVRSNLFRTIPLEMYPKNDSRYSKSEILGLIQMANGNLFIGTGNDDKIISYNPTNNEWWSFHISEGKPISPHRQLGIYDFSPLSESKIIVSGVKSIGIYDIETELYDPFPLGNTTDNQQALPSAARHAFIDSKGFLWLPSLMGISKSIQPIKSVFEKNNELIISQISIDQQIKQLSPSESSLPIHLEYGQKTVSMLFGFSNLGAFEQAKYNYRLLGRSNNWIEVDTGFLFFNKLKGGDYLLEMRGKIKNGDWSKVKSLPIKVDFFWWQTLWFKVLLIACAIGLIMIYFGLISAHRKKELKMKKQFEKNLAEVQMEALRAQMNPHFLFNSMNSINHYILKNESEKASSYLTKFARLIRQILHNSKSNSVLLSEELDALKLYIEIEQLRFDDGFDFTLHVDKEVQLDQIQVPPMLLQPYVENAIWHGLMHKDNNRKLTIRICKNNGLLQLIITDNGIGREASKAYQQAPGKKKSLGLQITSDRIALINQLYDTNTDIEIIDLKDRNGDSAGTEVVISLRIDD